MPRIELISCPSGDWYVLKLNGHLFSEGHEISNYDWIELIKECFKINVTEKQLSDEDMENGSYY